MSASDPKNLSELMDAMMPDDADENEGEVAEMETDPEIGEDEPEGEEEDQHQSAHEAQYQRILKKYGTPEKAVVALAGMQKVLGKQSAELGELRAFRRFVEAQGVAEKKEERSPKEVLRERVKSRIESGEDTLDVLLDALDDLAEQKAASKVDPIMKSQNARETNQALNSFFKSTPEAKDNDDFTEFVQHPRRAALFQGATDQDDIVEALETAWVMFARKSGLRLNREKKAPGARLDSGRTSRTQERGGSKRLSPDDLGKAVRSATSRGERAKLVEQLLPDM